MDRRPTRALIALSVLALIGLALVGSVSPASAHTRPMPLVDEPPAVAAVAAPLGEPPAPATIWLALVLTVFLGVAVAAPRRTLVVTLALVLVVLALETGVHSIHHLSDRQAAAQCAIASASAHVQGAEQPVSPDGVWVATPIGAVTTPDFDRPGSRPLRPDEGRAPPAA